MNGPLHKGHPESDLVRKVFRHLKIDPHWENEFLGLWKEYRFERNGFLTQAGEREGRFYVAAEGVQALYLLNTRADKVVFGFSYRGDPSGVFDSFLTRQPSSYFLEALTPSRLYGVSRDQYEYLFQLSPSFERWGRLFAEEVLFGRLRREVEMLTRSAEERYIAFMQRCPDELQQVPQKYLASYLNMSPETFSRLRSRVKY